MMASHGDQRQTGGAHLARAVAAGEPGGEARSGNQRRGERQHLNGREQQGGALDQLQVLRADECEAVEGEELDEDRGAARPKWPFHHRTNTSSTSPTASIRAERTAALPALPAQREPTTPLVW
jgi:hypothetical protein